MPPARRKLAIAAAAVAVAAGTFVALSPSDPGEREPAGATTTAVAPPAAPEPATTTATPPPAQPKAVVVSLRGGAPIGEVKTIEVDSGERVRLDVRSDTPQEIHVHGFDLTKTAAPGSPARFRFEADIEGRFEVETHATSTVIAEIAVSP